LTVYPIIMDGCRSEPLRLRKVSTLPRWLQLNLAVGEGSRSNSPTAMPLGNRLQSLRTLRKGQVSPSSHPRLTSLATGEQYDFYRCALIDIAVHALLLG
jgi:hypothetical protein